MATDDKLVSNEKLIRSWNKGAAKVIKSYYEHEKGLEGETLDFVCECSDLACLLTIPISIEEYEKIHKRKNRFVLAIGHDNPEIERVTDTRQKFEIVEKPQLAE